MFFGINVAGASLARQHGREVTIEAGGAVAIDPDDGAFQYLLEGRLALARQLLSNPRLAERTISSIASDAGFGDLSYFNRTFRRRYSVTPSDVRRNVRDSVRDRSPLFRGPHRYDRPAPRQGL
jgi:AraC-like DNA-binding protein